MEDRYVIRSVEALREVIPQASGATKSKVVKQLGALERAFIERSPMVIMGTASAEGVPSVSPKGDGPGFVSIGDDHTLIIPDRPGNGLAFGLTNLIHNPHIGLLFLIPGSTETFRVEGTAEITRDPELLKSLAARGKAAVVAIRVSIHVCYFHCAKAFLRSQLWSHEQWPAPFALSWGRWAQQWYGIADADAGQVDARIKQNERDEL